MRTSVRLFIITTEISLRVAFPLSAPLSMELISYDIFSGFPGIFPYIWRSNKAIISGRRFSNHNVLSITLVPSRQIRGSGSLYSGTLFSSKLALNLSLYPLNKFNIHQNFLMLLYKTLLLILFPIRMLFKL